MEVDGKDEEEEVKKSIEAPVLDADRGGANAGDETAATATGVAS